MKKVITLLIFMLLALAAFVPAMLRIEQGAQADAAEIVQLEEEMAQLDAARQGGQTQQQALAAQLEETQAQIAQLAQALEETEAAVKQYEDALYLHSAAGAKLDERFTPYRNLLTAVEQELYDLLRFSIHENRYEVDVAKFEMTLDEVADIYFSVINDDASLFWMSGKVTGYGWQNSSKVESVELHANYSLGDIEREKQAFDAQVAPVLEEARGLGNDYEKIRFIHDYLVETVGYDLEQKNGGSNTAILQKQAVCEGYARAFGYFINQLEIPSVFCTGTAGEESHAWNLVLLEGEYYNVDVTWDDPIGLPEGERIYDYFLLSDEVMEQTHTRDEQSLFLPVCSSKMYDRAAWRAAG